MKAEFIRLSKKQSECVEVWFYFEVELIGTRRVLEIHSIFNPKHPEMGISNSIRLKDDRLDRLKATLKITVPSGEVLTAQVSLIPNRLYCLSSGLTNVDLFKMVDKDERPTFKVGLEINRL